MSNYIYLMPNTEEFNLNYLEMGNGEVYESTIFDAGEIWYDSNGIIRHFSRRYDEGVVGNFVLMPIQQNGKNYATILAQDLTEFGLRLIGDSIFQGGSIVVNLAKFLFKKYSSVAVTDIISNYHDTELGYIAIDNNELVFKGKLTMEMGEYLSKIMFKVRNCSGINIKYELSKDGYNWTPKTLQKDKYIDHYFSNNQTKGYLRIFTNDVGFKTCEVYANTDYSIMWNPRFCIWDLYIN